MVASWSGSNGYANIIPSTGINCQEDILILSSFDGLFAAIFRAVSSAPNQAELKMNFLWLDNTLKKEVPFAPLWTTSVLD